MRRTLAVLGGLGLAVAFSQFPEYAQQYEQRLGGAVDELKILVADFDADAQRFGLNRHDALQRYNSSHDQFLVARGNSMSRTLDRYTQLSADLADLQGAGPLQRIAHLGDYLDSDIGARALAAYKPAVPVTAEGFLWAIAGFAFGYLVISAMIGFITLPLRWRNGHTPHRRVPLWRRQPREVEIDMVRLEKDVAPGDEAVRPVVIERDIVVQR